MLKTAEKINKKKTKWLHAASPVSSKSLEDLWHNIDLERGYILSQLHVVLV